MARGLNKVMLIGNLGNDPEIRHTNSGMAVATLSLATAESWKDRDSGETRDKTEWHRVVFFGRVAEVAEQYLKKGSQIYIEGRLQTRKWQNKEGQDVYTTEVVVDINGQMQMLDSRGGEGGMSQGAPAGRPQQSGYNAPAGQQNNPPPQSGGYSNQPSQGSMPEPVDDFDDDIPF